MFGEFLNLFSDAMGSPALFVGCFAPYQFVNPFYSTYTAKTCASMYFGESYFTAPRLEDVRFGCDCVDGMVQNYKGYCILESDCDLWEAFGPQMGFGSSNQISEAKQENTVKTKLDTSRGQSNQLTDITKSIENNQQIENDIRTSDQNFGEFIPMVFQQEIYGIFAVFNIFIAPNIEHHKCYKLFFSR